MTQLIQKLWWTVALRGMLLLIFGIIALTAPLMPSETLMSYLSFLLLGMGIIVLVAVVSMRQNVSAWILLSFISLLDIALGGFILFNTHKSAGVFFKIIAAWALIMGLSQFLLAIRPSALRIFLLINGILSLGFALAIYFRVFSESNINFIVGLYTLLMSLFFLFVAFKMKMIKGKEEADSLHLNDNNETESDSR